LLGSAGGEIEEEEEDDEEEEASSATRTEGLLRGDRELGTTGVGRKGIGGGSDRKLIGLGEEGEGEWCFFMLPRLAADSLFFRTSLLLLLLLPLEALSLESVKLTLTPLRNKFAVTWEMLMERLA
jgi:hypothetical protein